jgi:hypothetical protein
MMTTLALRVLERIHGHLGWLSVVALLHPAILLRNPKRRARLSVALATASVVVAGLLGATIYPHYRERVKQELFLQAPGVGWLFERKEHLAVGALALALAGCIAHLSVPLFNVETTRRTMAQLGHRAFVASFALALLVASLGVVVASYRSF